MSQIIGETKLSRPGAAISVTRLELSEATKAALAVGPAKDRWYHIVAGIVLLMLVILGLIAFACFLVASEPDTTITIDTPITQHGYR